MSGAGPAMPPSPEGLPVPSGDPQPPEPSLQSALEPPQPPPIPRGKAPYRWKGYPGVPLTGVKRSPIAAIGIVLAALVALIVLTTAVGLVGAAAEWSRDVWALSLLGAYLLGYGVWFGLTRLGKRHAHVPFGERFGLRAFDVLPGLIAAFVVMSLTLYFELLYGGVIVLLGIEIPKLPSVAEVFPPTLIGVGVAVIVTCIAAPLSEEVLFRGVLFGGLRDRWGDWPAALVSGAVFAASHLSWYVFLPFTILGVLLAWITSQARSIWPAVIAHAAFNANALVLGYLYHYLMRGDPAWLSGLPRVIAVLLR